MSYINSKIHEAQRIPRRIHVKKPTTGNSLFKLKKVKDKEKSRKKPEE